MTKFDAQEELRRVLDELRAALNLKGRELRETIEILGRSIEKRLETIGFEEAED